MSTALSSPFLFTHQYDIDAVINALCAATSGWLNTETGQIQPIPTPAPQGHLFPITPLPASIVSTLASHPHLRFLNQQDEAELQTLLSNTPVQAFPQVFGQGRAGAWLHERIKDYALEYLATNNLIPPSLRHINRNTAPQVTKSKVTIS